MAFIPLDSEEGTDVENASRFNSEEAVKVVEVVQKLLEIVLIHLLKSTVVLELLEGCR